jgi:endonuclease/exonuclease/phosphatase family metal-dependent hydrolase
MLLDFFRTRALRALHIVLVYTLFFYVPNIFAQSNVNLRVMAANLNGNTQSYQPFALRILQGLKPDVVCIQEFNYASTNGVDVNDALAMREMVNAAFGTNFSYYREPFNGSGDIPNGVISRYPIIASGSWADTVQSQPNRGFAWAQIDVPGTNDLYVVSVHLLTSSAANRAAEASNLKVLMQAAFPSNAWIVLAGDFNADPRTEACITTFSGYLSDFPIPVDNLGNSDTSINRNSPHDYVLPSLSFTNIETASVLPSNIFPSGLVFDSRVYTPLSDVPPILFGDSSNAQHMAVMKDFLIPVTGGVITNAPTITAQPQSQIVPPGSNVTFTVTATGTAPLNYQWSFNGTNIGGALTNNYTIINAQAANTGSYSVLVTNIAGGINSSTAVLIVSNQPPTITRQPQSQTVYIGDSATFSVVTSGVGPLGYQWISNGTNIPGANTNFYARNNVQPSDAGNFIVVVTNLAGTITSAPPALLTVIASNQLSIIAQWNFNSTTPDANASTGVTTPSIGSGSATLTGGTTATFAGGDTTLDAGSTDNSGWNTTAYPAATANNKTAGAQFDVSSVSRQNIVVTWSERVSNTGSKYTRLQYTTNGTAFVDFPTAVSVGAATTFEPRTNNLAALPGVNNNPNFAFRLVAEFESTAAGTANANYVGANGTYGTAGTTRFDMVTVSGSAIVSNKPPVFATLSVLGNAVGGFQLQLTGTAGANYAIQTSTNLTANAWTSLVTNTSPFSFIDSSSTGTAQKFYRATSTP